MEFLHSNPIYITALSTLLGVFITLYFTNKRERNKFLLDSKHNEYIELREFYVQLIASIDKIKRMTEYGESYDSLVNEMSLISSKTYLIGSEIVNQQMIKISKLMYEWSSNYKMGLPRTIGELGVSVGSKGDKVQKLEAELNSEIGTLIKIVKEELSKSKKLLYK